MTTKMIILKKEKIFQKLKPNKNLVESKKCLRLEVSIKTKISRLRQRPRDNCRDLPRLSRLLRLSIV